MYKSGWNVPSAGVVGELNSLPDMISLAEQFYSFGHDRASDSSSAHVYDGSGPDEGVKDISAAMAGCACSLCSAVDLATGTVTPGIDISSKSWMLANGYLSLPNMEYNDFGRFSTADPLADEPLLNVLVGGTVSGNIDVTGDTDDIRVFLVTGQTYHVSLRGTGPNALNDTFLEVYDPSAALVNFDDDGGNDLFSMMTFTAAATGNFTIRAASFSNPGDPGTGGWTVDVRVQGADAVGDTNATAVQIEIGSTTFGFRETATVSGGNDLDRYEVNLEAGKFYTFKVAAGADYATDYTAVPAGEIDTILRLRNAAGTLVAQNDDIAFPGDISSAFGFLAQTTGTYYLDVTGYAGQTGGYAIETAQIDYENLDPLDAIRWKSADNIDTVDVNGTPTAYVYFGLAGENFGQSNFGASWGFTAKEKAAVMSSLLEYTKITGIQYVETLDQNLAEFRLNTVNGPNPPVSYGAYFFPQDPVYGAAQGVGIFNVNSGGWDKPGVSTQDIPGNQVSLDKGGFAYAVILHEFGHAHGLAHPHDNGGGSDVLLGVTAPTNSYGIFNLNQGVYTVMSYNDAWDFHPDGPSPFTIAGIGNGWSGTLGAFDIAALQERYGVHAYATGDSVYTLASAQGTGVYYETIWDTGGNDTIAYGGTGNARIDLTAATLDYSATGGGVLSFVDQIPGTAGVDGIFGGYTIANGVVIENASGGSGSDVLIGNAVANVLNGGAGADQMLGRGGDDTYLVDNAGDTTVEDVGGGFDRVVSSINYALTEGAEIEMLYGSDFDGTAGLWLTGNDLAQTIYGDAGGNLLSGYGGDDVLNGLDGNDALDGGNGGDALVGGNGIDILDGRDGSDYLIGGADVDGFRFTAALGPDNVDRIVDFVSGTDRIQLASATFTGLGVGSLDAGAFVTGTAAQDADDRIVYDSSTGALYFDADGNGAGAAIQFATLLGSVPLIASDFDVI